MANSLREEIMRALDAAAHNEMQSICAIEALLREKMTESFSAGFVAGQATEAERIKKKSLLWG